MEAEEAGWLGFDEVAGTVGLLSVEEVLSLSVQVVEELEASVVGFGGTEVVEIELECE